MVLKRPLEHNDRITILSAIAGLLIWFYYRGRRYV